MFVDIISYVFKDNIFIRYWNTIYRQVVGVPISINCARHVADLFSFLAMREFMNSLKPDTQAESVNAFNETSREVGVCFVLRFLLEVFLTYSRYLDDILN